MVQPQLAADRTQRHALDTQLLDRGEPFAGAYRQSTFPPAGIEHAVRHGQRCVRHQCRGLDFGQLRLGQAGAVCDDGGFDGFAEVLPQMEAIGDLDRVWCA